MSKEKVEWKNYRGVYLGLSDIPKTGKKKDGTDWVRNKLSFSHAEGKKVSFGTFLDIGNLKTSVAYHILFKEEMIPNHEFKTKTAVKIEPHTDETKELGFEQKITTDSTFNSGFATSDGTSPKTQPLPTLKKRQPEVDPTAFANWYRETEEIEMADKTLPDFIGRFIKNNNRQLYDDLEKMFDNVVHPKPKKDFKA